MAEASSTMQITCVISSALARSGCVRSKLDDELLVTCEPSVEGAVTIRFAQRIHRKDAGDSKTLLVEADVRVACVDASTLRPRRLPDFLT
jgi:acyl-CoA thioesterase FadM